MTLKAVEQPDTMRIWSKVAETDPAHTKKVNQRGGFTAISAHYQVMRATEIFGPVGEGWGYEVGEPIFHDALVIVPVTIWHGNRERTFGPIYGGAEWKSGNRLDSDAVKKATTDGLTKGLSQLGFNADVFLGKFDDNKYIEGMNAKFHGDGMNADRITERQESDLTALAQEVGADMQRFVKYLGVKALSDLPADRYQEAVNGLEAKRQKAA